MAKSLSDILPSSGSNLSNWVSVCGECICVCVYVYIYLLFSSEAVCAYLGKCKAFRSIKNEVSTEYAFLHTRKLICGPCQIETHNQWVFVIAYEIIKGGVAVGVVSPPTSAAQF